MINRMFKQHFQVAAEFSDYLETALLNHLLRNTQHTTPGTSIYVGLYTTDPTDADSGTEVSGTNYARVQVTAWDVPSGGATANTNEIAFPQAGAGGWGTITHFTIHDASSSGNLLFHSALGASKLVNDGDTVKFAAGALTVTLA